MTEAGMSEQAFRRSRQVRNACSWAVFVRPQFTLRALLILMALLSVVFHRVVSWRGNAEALRALERCGAFVTVGPDPTCHESPTREEQNLLERVIGNEGARRCVDRLMVPRRTRISFVGRPFPPKCLKLLGALSRFEAFSMDGFLMPDTTFGDREMVSILRISSLRSFSLDTNAAVTDNGIRCLCNARRLEYLMLAKCLRVEGAGLASLADLHELRTLYLRQMRATDTLAVALQNKPMLEHLTLAEMDVSPETFAMIPSLPRLQRLSLVSSRFDGDALAALLTAPMINELDLRFTDVTDAELKLLLGVKELRLLLLNGTCVSGSGVDSFATARSFCVIQR